MSRLAEAVAAHAARNPDGIAIDDGSRRLSWRALDTLLPELVAELAEAWPAADRPAAVALDHGIANCLLDLALTEAGIAALPLPPFFTAEQSRHAVASAGAAAVIRPGVGPGSSAIERRLGITIEPCATTPAALPPRTGRISFTSGSTGRPKGLCLANAHLISVAEAVVAAVGADRAGRHLPLLQPGILLEGVAGFYASLLAGGTYVALAQTQAGLEDPFRPDMMRVLSAIETHRISSLILVPEYLAGLVAALERSGRRLPELTLVAVGGARVSPALLDRARAVGLPVRQGYGLTECGSVVALESGDEAGSGSVGSGLGLNAIELAEDGEILVHGPLFLGTIGAPRRAGPLRTGDLGRIDEAGRLWIEGRKSNLIVTGFGRNVSPEWIEGALCERPEILQAMVRGDGDAALGALVVPASPSADLAAAIDAVNAGLPAYARIAAWQAVPPFTPASGLLTGNGRLRRDAIDAAYPRNPGRLTFFERLVVETREAQARFAATPQLQAGLGGRIGRSDYLAYLGEAFHHVRHTVPLMREARARLGHRPELVEALDEYIAEESGHEQWILADIDAAGGDSRAVEAGRPAPATAAMVEHAYRTIRGGAPAAFFGMVFVLEGTSTAMATQGAEAVRARLGLPREAFRYLTSHGALDQQHMLFFEQLMNRIDDPEEQRSIIAMARDMFALFGEVFASIELEAARAAA